MRRGAGGKSIETKLLRDMAGRDYRQALPHHGTRCSKAFSSWQMPEAALC